MLKTTWAPPASAKDDTMKTTNPTPAAASLSHIDISLLKSMLFFICSNRTKQDQMATGNKQILSGRKCLYLTNKLINIYVMQMLDTTFAALADPTRRAILARLALGEATVGELAEPFPITAPAISRHLKVLEGAALITRTRRGQQLICHLNPAGMRSAQEWLDHYRAFWSSSFDRLDAHLKKPKENDK
jgi:DNA-binding transcriptional ArsR family regulator